MATAEVAGDGLCSLPEAIDAANQNVAVDACPAGEETTTDVIELMAGVHEIDLPLPTVTESVEIAGAGRSATTIEGNGTRPGLHFLTVDSAAEFRVSGIHFQNLERDEPGGAIQFELDGTLTVADCYFADNTSDSYGGAIAADGAGTLVIERSGFEGNVALLGGGAVAIFSTTAVIDASTFRANEATGTEADGGAIWASGFVPARGTTALDFHLRRSTLHGNRAYGHGGGLYLFDLQSRLEHNSITFNGADADFDQLGDGGGVVLDQGDVTLLNNVIAENLDLSSVLLDGAVDLACDLSIFLPTITSEAFNFVGNHEGCETPFPAGANGNANPTGDFVGSTDEPITPELEDLADWGGPVWTRPPQPTSPLIDAGRCDLELEDQRNFRSAFLLQRAVDDSSVADGFDGCDIGAVERGAVDPTALLFVDDFASGDTGAWALTEPPP